MENKIRIRVGENEIELSGSEKFIEKHLEAFSARIGNGNISPQKISQVEISNSPSAQRKSGKQPSPTEYFREKSPKGGTEQLIVLGKYLEDFKGAEEFTQKDIKALVKSAKIKSIHSNYFNYAVQQGLMRTLGHGKYSLTLSGEDAVLAMPKNKVK